ncbi:uncharacterized protein [Nicotiana sylvestris]|uniref:uncharacterized protein n=1 Tax=Nicotiana sylvestris TaxID=4096 RepID=UPI00388CB505
MPPKTTAASTGQKATKVPEREISYTMDSDPSEIMGSIEEDPSEDPYEPSVRVVSTTLAVDGVRGVPTSPRPLVSQPVDQGLGDRVSIRPSLNGEEGTSKPDKVKKRNKEASVDSPKSEKPKARWPRANAQVSTLAAMASPCIEVEGDVDDDDENPLVQMAKRGAEAPQVVGQKAAESGVAKKMYDHAFYRLQDELSCCRKELKKLTSVLKESEASSARKGEELSGLRASLEQVRLERAGLAEKEEVATKNAEILELRGKNEVVTSDRDLLQSELALIQGLLRSAQKEAVALSVAKYEAEENASSYMKDVATMNERSREILEKTEQKLTRAITYSRSKARREALEEASAKGVDISTEIKEARVLEEESAFSATSNEGSGDEPENSGGEK